VHPLRAQTSLLLRAATSRGTGGGIDPDIQFARKNFNSYQREGKAVSSGDLASRDSVAKKVPSIM